LIDGIANGLARLTQDASAELRKLQTGYVRQYALSILFGVVVVLAWLILR
jgi:NADH-quinone oxidoreductase subunit L